MPGAVDDLPTPQTVAFSEKSLHDQRIQLAAAKEMFTRTTEAIAKELGVTTEKALRLLQGEPPVRAWP